MSTTIIKNSRYWVCVYDNTMGVSTVQHKTFHDLCRNWNTGQDAIEEIKAVKEMTDKEFISYCQEQTNIVFDMMPF